MSSLDPSKPSDTSKASLSHRTARGYAWMAAQGVLAKFVTTFGQIALAWFLVPEDFGLVAIAYMVGMLPAFIQQGGLKEVLIRRHRRFDRWATPAFWLGNVLGLAGGGLMVALAPVIAHFYGDQRLTGLLLIVAVQFPVGGLGIVPQAMMEAQLRFKLGAALAFGQAMAQISMAVFFAGVLDLGPYSLVLPRPIAMIGVVIISWIALRPRVSWKLNVRRWKYMISDGAMIITANASDLLLSYGGYLILSLFEETRVVGLYYFAFNLSQQTILLIVLRLRGVLFPALSSLQDQPERQTAAFLRALHVMSCVVVPACFLQAALSDAGVRAVFAERWFPAIPLLQILSLAMVMRSIGWPATAMLQAQGRFRTRMNLGLIATGLLAVNGTIGAAMGGAIGVAIAVALQLLIIEPINLYVAVCTAGRGWRDIGAATIRPLILGVATIGPAYAASFLVPTGPAQPWLQLGVVLVISGVLYIPLFKRIAPEAWAESTMRLRAILGRTSSK